MNSRKTATLLLLSLLSFRFGLAAGFADEHAPGPSIFFNERLLTADTDFEFRDSPPSMKELPEPNTEAEKILTVIDDPQNGKRGDERRLYTLTDFHARFPFKIERIVPVFLDYAREASVYDRLTYTRDLNPEAGPYEGHFQEVKTAFRFLGIGTKQHYVLYKKARWLSEDEFILKWSLADSIEGDFYKYSGSWYLKRLSDGTYLRNYAAIGFIEPPRGIKMVYTLFLVREVQNFFADVREAVAKRDKE